MWDSYRAAVDAEILPEVSWVGLVNWSGTGAADTDEVSELHALIEDAVPEAGFHWRFITSLLFAVRSKALQPEWKSWGNQDRRRYIQKIASEKCGDLPEPMRKHLKALED
jgi:hypothetical protein